MGGGRVLAGLRALVLIRVRVMNRSPCLPHELSVASNEFGRSASRFVIYRLPSVEPETPPSQKDKAGK
uniref:Uncharacterized protein n=1 Tax=Picea glauca TaxID=3330 RepID=A0A117NFV6_PICGL|nr:hypothetical protein ABT39_MTgene2202 [Picea glauca]